MAKTSWRWTMAFVSACLPVAATAQTLPESTNPAPVVKAYKIDTAKSGYSARCLNVESPPSNCTESGAQFCLYFDNDKKRPFARDGNDGSILKMIPGNMLSVGYEYSHEKSQWLNPLNNKDYRSDAIDAANRWLLRCFGAKSLDSKFFTELFDGGEPLNTDDVVVEWKSGRDAQIKYSKDLHVWLKDKFSGNRSETAPDHGPNVQPDSQTKMHNAATPPPSPGVLPRANELDKLHQDLADKLVEVYKDIKEMKSKLDAVQPAVGKLNDLSDKVGTVLSALTGEGGKEPGLTKNVQEANSKIERLQSSLDALKSLMDTQQRDPNKPSGTVDNLYALIEKYETDIKRILKENTDRIKSLDAHLQNKRAEEEAVAERLRHGSESANFDRLFSDLRVMLGLMIAAQFLIAAFLVLNARARRMSWTLDDAGRQAVGQAVEEVFTKLHPGLVSGAVEGGNSPIGKLRHRVDDWWKGNGDFANLPTAQRNVTISLASVGERFIYEVARTKQLGLNDVAEALDLDAAVGDLQEFLQSVGNNVFEPAWQRLYRAQCDNGFSWLNLGLRAAMVLEKCYADDQRLASLQCACQQISDVGLAALSRLGIRVIVPQLLEIPDGPVETGFLRNKTYAKLPAIRRAVQEKLADQVVGFVVDLHVLGYESAEGRGSPPKVSIVNPSNWM